MCPACQDDYHQQGGPDAETRQHFLFSFFFQILFYFISNLFFNLTHRPAFCTFCSQHQLLTLPESLLGGRQWAKYFICYVFGFSQSENSIIFLILQMVNLSFLKANRFA